MYKGIPQHYVCAPSRVADWFAQLNNKMGGDLKKIRVVGEYMIEVWKAVGMDLSRVEFLSASDEINKRPAEYWTLVMDIAIKNNLKRIIRCSQIMGRAETDELSAAQIFYPCMQCADIFFLKVCLQLAFLGRHVSVAITHNVQMKLRWTLSQAADGSCCLLSCFVCLHMIISKCRSYCSCGVLGMLNRLTSQSLCM